MPVSPGHQDALHQGLAPGEGQVFLGAGGDTPAHPKPEQLAHIYRLGDPALSELPLEALLDELLERAVDVLGVDTAAILLHDEDTHELVARAAKGLEEEVERGTRIPIARGFAGRVAANRVPIFIADVNRADIVNPILREKGVRSMLGVPLIAEGQLLGVLHVGSLTPRLFTNEDAVVLQLTGARAAPAIERARIVEALEREHRAAVGLQRSLLPDRLPEILGIPVAARYLPARAEVGGDWYDVLLLGAGTVGIAIGDVAGHGVRAAALMSELRSGMRAYALDGHSPGGVLERTDRMLQTVREWGMATAAYACLDTASGVLRYAVAGHPPPLLIPADGPPRLLEGEPGPPLGAMPYAGYGEQEVTLRGGDMILFFTDGLVERRGRPLGEGLDRLAEAAAGARSAEGLCQQVAAALVPAEGGADDIAMIALHCQPVPDRIELQLPARPETLAEVRRTLRRWLWAMGAGEPDIGSVMLAVSEACANAIEHAYSPSPAAYTLEVRKEEGVVSATVRDNGRWRRPRGANRGRGLTIMENAMDELEVRQTAEGTELVMRRRLRGEW